MARHARPPSGTCSRSGGRSTVLPAQVQPGARLALEQLHPGRDEHRFELSRPSPADLSRRVPRPEGRPSPADLSRPSPVGRQPSRPAYRRSISSTPAPVHARPHGRTTSSGSATSRSPAGDRSCSCPHSRRRPLVDRPRRAPCRPGTRVEVLRPVARRSEPNRCPATEWVTCHSTRSFGRRGRAVAGLVGAGWMVTAVTAIQPRAGTGTIATTRRRSSSWVRTCHLPGLSAASESALCCSRQRRTGRSRVGGAWT